MVRGFVALELVASGLADLRAAAFLRGKEWVHYDPHSFPSDSPF